MQSFYEYAQLIQAKQQLAKLKNDRNNNKNAGKIDLKMFYQQKKGLEAKIQAYQNAQKANLNIHQEYNLQHILAFAFAELQIDDLCDSPINDLRLFTKKYTNSPQANTIVILDSYDDDNEEGYTEYVLKNKLELLYNGELFVDVVSSYLNYTTDFDVNLLIQALKYYSEYDCFMEIKS